MFTILSSYLRLLFSSIPDLENLCRRTVNTSSIVTPLTDSKTIAWYRTSAISDAVRGVSSLSSRVLHNSSASSLQPKCPKIKWQLLHLGSSDLIKSSCTININQQMQNILQMHNILHMQKIKQKNNISNSTVKIYRIFEQSNLLSSINRLVHEGFANDNTDISVFRWTIVASRDCNVVIANLFSSD